MRANSAHNKKFFVNKFKPYEKPKPGKCPHHGSNSPHRHPPVPRAGASSPSRRSPKSGAGSASPNKSRRKHAAVEIEVQTDPFEVVYNTFEPGFSNFPDEDPVYTTIMADLVVNEVPSKPVYKIFDNVDWATSTLYEIVSKNLPTESSFK